MKGELFLIASLISPAVIADCECKGDDIIHQYVRGVCIEAITDITSTCKEEIVDELQSIQDNTDKLMRMNMEMAQQIRELRDGR
jgi:hypothetical protein